MDRVVVSGFGAPVGLGRFGEIWALVPEFRLLRIAPGLSTPVYYRRWSGWMFAPLNSILVDREQERPLEGH